MPTKPLERFMFAQGGLCFFCAEPLAKVDASIEHLVPTARSGSNSDDNCVACCKALNTLLGSMSLKEKIKVVLAQKGNFRCPNTESSGSVELIDAVQAPSQTALPPLTTPLIAPPVVVPTTPAQKKIPDPPVDKHPLSAREQLARVIQILQGLGKARPQTLKTLTSTVKMLPLELTDKQVQSVMDRLKSQGKIAVNGTKIAYKL